MKSLQVLGLLGLIGGASLIDAQSCSTVRRRREIHELSSDELDRFINSIRAIHNTRDGSNSWSIYEKFARQHMDFAGINHNSASFFPYHRQLLHDFETELRKIDSSVTVPYWNWTIYSQSPGTDPVLSSAILGDSGRAGLGCISTNGKLGAWSHSPYWPASNACIQRSYVPGQSNGRTFHLWGTILDAMDRNPTYSNFRSTLEIYHGTPHVFVGGGMNSMMSPMDPIFWVHHAFIDAIWDVYQKKYDAGFSNYNGVRGDGRSVSVADPLTPYTQTAASVMNSASICVQYVSTATSSNAPSGPAVTQVVAPRIDESWTQMNGFTSNDVTVADSTAKESTEKLQKEIDTALENGGGFVPGVGQVGKSSAFGNVRVGVGMLFGGVLFALMAM